MLYLVDLVFLCEHIELRVHVVEHGHHLHGRDVTADTGETNHITE